MTQTVAIIGATGLQGGSVLRSLHSAGKYNITAVTRNTSSASATEIKSKYPDVKLIKADLDDVESLTKAFKNTDLVFGMTLFDQPDIMNRIAAGDVDVEFNHGKNIADAAIASGVKDIIFSTLYSMSELSNGECLDAIQFDGKYKIEKYIKSKATEIRGAFIHVGYYMENYVSLSRISPEDNRTVEFAIPAKPTTKLPLVDIAKDTGGVVSHMLDNFDDFVGKTMPVCSGFYEAQDMVNAFTEVTGKPARCLRIPFDICTEDMTRMYKRYDEFGYFEPNTDVLELNKKMGYKPTTPTEFWKNRGWAGPSQ